MVIRIRTELGPVAARILAMHTAGKEVFVSCVYFVPDQPGYEDYIFTTNGRKKEGEPMITVET